VHPKNPGFHARCILREKERYNVCDINLALGHACRYRAYDCKAVERILLAKATPRTLESFRNEKAAEHLRAALPKIIQRPLAEYAVLFTHANIKQEACQPHEDAGEHRENQGTSENPEA